MREALIDSAAGVVVNVIETDGTFPAPAGYLLVASDAAGPGWLWNGSDLVAPIVDIAQALAAQYAGLGDKRWQVETSGFTIAALGGMRIPSDDRSKVLIGGAYEAARIPGADPDAAGAFKAGPGVFADLTNAQFVVIGQGMAAFVQLCFNAERDHAAALVALSQAEGATAQAVLDYDITTGWPTGV